MGHLAEEGTGDEERAVLHDVVEDLHVPVAELRAAGHALTYPPAGDFLADGSHLFEVGGRRKSFDQIKDIPDSYLAVDDLEIGYGNRIPLRMFGLLH